MHVINKNRGKSAVVPVGGQPPQFLSSQLQQQQPPTTSSLLKIESVLPTLGRNTNKSIYRSYSTLSTGYFKSKTTDLKTELDIRKQLLNGQQNLPNGFWRIHRSSKEKEKLPDRINLDRRGLTALPIIEDEPNLRLLSLQHNLINSFSVPDHHKYDKVEEKKPTVPVDSASTKRIEPPIVKMVPSSASQLQKVPKHQQFLMQKHSSRNLHVNGNTISSHNKYTSNGSSSAHQPNQPSSTTTLANPMKSSFIQKSMLFHAKERYVFKKSNSFINNYSQHLATSKMHLGRLKESNKLNFMSIASNDSVQPSDSEVYAKNQTQFPSANTTSSSASSTTAIIVPSPVPNNSTNNVLGNINEGLIVKNDPFLGYTNNLQNLVFIDLYDNQIEKICSLDGLKSLTVLLLGKNRISDISGIVSVKNSLRVLDLHGNKISNISQKICQLQELKSLNLAGNSLKQIHADDFKGLFNLRELNLKRNKIKKLNGFTDLRNLERLWLCHNDLQKVEDMSCIAKAINLKEVTIENNPVSLGGDCVSFVVSYLPSLILLSQMQVTEQVRRAAMAWRKSKETSDANYSHLSHDVCHSIRREEIISNARTNWELLRSQQHVNKTSSYIQKTIKNTSQQLQVPVSELEVADVYSDLSDSLKIDRKLVVRQKTISMQSHKKGKKSLKHSKRSTSQDNLLQEPADAANTILPEEFFRLPPILAPFLDDSTTSTGTRPSNSSGSSLGPNVDSSSSNLSSDNEESSTQIETQNDDEPQNMSAVDEMLTNYTEKIENHQLEPYAAPTTPIEEPEKIINNENFASDAPSQSSLLEPPVQDTRHTIETPICNSNEQQAAVDEDSDKNSNISTHSSCKKIDSSSVVTTNNNTAPEDSRPIKNYKNPTANTNRRNGTATLVRSNTIRNQSASTNCPTNATVALSSNVQKNTKTPVINEREREQGGDYLIEICGRYLNVYGAGAIKFIDRQWNTQKANDVHTFKFSYVNFNSIATVLNRIKFRFPNAENFVFRETNINSLGQINSLAEIQGISSLVIEPEGNLICTKNWRPYTIYRLSHWGIKCINGVDVTEAEIEEAQNAYSGLSDLVLWSLPESLIEPLLTRLRLDETCSASKMSAKQWLMQADPSLKNVVGKEALQSKKLVQAPDETVLRQRGKTYFSTMMENTCNAVEKLQKLETLWPNLLVEMIRNTLLDYSQIDVYIKNLMSDMMAKTTQQ